MKVQNTINRCNTFSCIAFFFGICIAWTGCKTFASVERLKRAGPVGDINDLGESLSGTAGRIVGGIECVPNSHPYVAFLIIQETSGLKSACGGTILTDEWVMTAAHCINEAVWVVVKAGKHNVSKTETTEQNANSTKLVFDMYNETEDLHDIGFVRFSPKLKFNNFVKPAKLVAANWSKTVMATVVGWGKTTNNNTPRSQVLREVDVPIMLNKKCQQYYPGATIRDTHLCAGYDAGGKDACLGDSGGPLFVKEAGEEIVVGIVSAGDGCGIPKKPTVYTRVSKYRDYIKKWTGYKRSIGGRTSLSSVISENLCQQYEVFLDEDRLPPPVKERPRGDNKCAWFDWIRECDSGSCNSFKFAHC